MLEDEERREPSRLPDRCLEITESCPYFLQEWGFHVWNEAESQEFDLALVEQVSPKVTERLDKNFFLVRFDRLTPLQQKYLRAMSMCSGD